MDKTNNNTTIVVKQIPTYISNIRQFYEYENITITNRDEFETASAYFLQTKAHLKLVEEERKKIVDPINKALKATNDLFKRISDPLNKIKDQLNSKMKVFADGERKKLEDLKAFVIGYPIDENSISSDVLFKFKRDISIQFNFRFH